MTHVVTREDLRFYGLLALAFGVLFLAGGRIAAFTIIGAVLMLAGSLMLLVAPLLLQSLKVMVVSMLFIVLLWTVPLSVLG